MQISKDSALVIEGANIELRSLDLDGTLWLHVSCEAKLIVDGLKLRNAGWKWWALNPDKPMTEEEYIRYESLSWCCEHCHGSAMLQVLM